MRSRRSRDTAKHLGMDIQSPRLLYLKGGLFLLVAAVSAGLVWLECPTWRQAGLLGLAIWAACRAYYFAFYVISHYIDPGYRFAGLVDFARYAVGRRRAGEVAGRAMDRYT